jgi:hydroxypyruvate reductase
VLRRYGIDPPRAIAEHLEKAEETPKPGDEVFEGVANVICGGGRHAAEAAAEQARELGYEPMLLSTTITGDARPVASVHAAVAREVLESGNPARPPCALVSAGEATVIVRGDGTGGPNQEFALTLAVELDGVEGWAALAADTDGNDGSTDAAGGLVSGATAQAIREAGIDPSEALENNDAHPALKAAGALIVTGPTGTNVNDVRVLLVRDPGSQ